VGADNAVTLCDLRIFVEEAAELVASADPDVFVGRRDVGRAVGWSLAECPWPRWVRSATLRRSSSSRFR